MPTEEIVTLRVGGADYTAWKSVSVKYSAQSAERSFQVVAADEAPELISNAWMFEPGKSVEVLAGSSLLIAGFINTLEINLEDDMHEIRIGGRSRGQDCHDCSVDHQSYEWRDKTLLEIAQDTGIPVQYRTDEALQKIPVVRANVGEPVFGFLDRHARAQGLFLAGQADGTVLITKHGKHFHGGALIEGLNILKGRAHFSDKDRHQKYKVKGQLPTGSGEDAIQIEEEAEDAGARPGRVRHFMPDQTLDRGRARTRADQINRTRQGMSTKATITTQGFRDEDGLIWNAGWMVMIQSMMLHLSRDLAIESVELQQDSHHGSTSTLEFVDPRALGSGGKGKGKDRSASAWSKGWGKSRK